MIDMIDVMEDYKNNNNNLRTPPRTWFVCFLIIIIVFVSFTINHTSLQALLLHPLFSLSPMMCMRLDMWMCSEGAYSSPFTAMTGITKSRLIKRLLVEAVDTNILLLVPGKERERTF